MKVVLSLATAVFLLTSLDVNAQSRRQVRAQIPAAQAGEFAGQEATVCGRVEQIQHDGGATGAPSYLHVGGRAPSSALQVKIWGRNRDRFDALEDFVGKDVCASGLITANGGQAEIVVSAPNRLQLQ